MNDLLFNWNYSIIIKQVKAAEFTLMYKPTSILYCYRKPSPLKSISESGR